MSIPKPRRHWTLNLSDALTVTGGVAYICYLVVRVRASGVVS